MVNLDEQTIAAAAPNAGAVSNGRSLVAKGKFANLGVDADETILWGECAGSGKTPYRVSSDFARADQPTHRCSCPSRQFPCKHAVGLMFAWVLKRGDFKTGDVPDDLAEKRGKLAARVEKKAEEAKKPKKVNKTALAKKVKAQLDGLDLLESLVLDLVRLGVGNTNAKNAREVEEKAKRLGDAYLPGAQAALRQYTDLFRDEADPKAARAGEAHYSEALATLARLHALVKRGRLYLQQRLDDPELAPETDSPIAAWLGHAWQLSELRACGLVESDVELLQVAFNVHDDRPRQEFVDTGVWLNLNTGRVQLTQTFRPYKAAKHIKSDDSVQGVAQVKELCVYPGDVNPRVRWEAMKLRPAEAADYERVREHASPDFAAVVKEVKNNLKSPLADRTPIHAIRFAKIGEVGDTPVVEDASGTRLTLTDRGMAEEPPSTHLLRLIPEDLHRDAVMIARFRHDLDTRQLGVKPLAIVTAGDVVRLTL